MSSLAVGLGAGRDATHMGWSDSETASASLVGKYGPMGAIAVMFAAVLRRFAIEHGVWEFVIQLLRLEVLATY